MTDHELDGLARRVGEALAARGLWLATAESCTGGWIAEAVTAIAGSSGWFDRGFVTYSNAAKADMLGVPDHGGIVWDEMVAIWLVLLFTPAGLLWQVVAVVLFRFFDIAKPPPVRWADRSFKGGFGVMFDDIVAAGYTLLVLAVLVHLLGN